jgi:hypothetical protein
MNDVRRVSAVICAFFGAESLHALFTEAWWRYDSPPFDELLFAKGVTTPADRKFLFSRC